MSVKMDSFPNIELALWRKLDIFQHETESALNDYLSKWANQSISLDAPLIVKFNLDFKKLSTMKPVKVILDSILDEPLQSQKDIRSAAYLYISSLLFEKFPEISLQPQQIHCIIRFTNLPLTAEYEFIPFQHPVRLSLSGMKCVLHSFGDKYLYVRQSIWYCPKHCANNQKHIFDGESSVGQKCFECNGDLSEYEHFRSTYSSRLVRVFNARSVDTPIQYGKIHRDVRVKLSDDLCDVEMILGQIYMLIGTYDIITQTYIAWNFYKDQ